jgi:hypothetical protein
MTTLARSVLAVAHGQLNPDVTTERFIRTRWGSTAMDSVAPLLRAASTSAATSTTGWAKELGQTTQAFLQNLVPLSAGADVLGRGLQLTFDGAATINAAAVTTPLADFVTQNAPIPVVQGTSAQVSLSPCKFATIVVLSRETVESSNAEALVADALRNQVAPSLDRRLFDTNTAVADLRPAGLLYNKVALTPAAVADKTFNLIADLAALGEAVSGYAGNGGFVYIAAPRQALSIALAPIREFNYPLLTSTSLTAGTVICIAANAVVSALGAAPQIDLTKAATFHMSDAPSAIATGGTMATPTQVTFQNDTVGVRLRWPISWALRNQNAIAFMSAVTWP